MNKPIESALATYAHAKAFVSEAGFQGEVDWQRSRRPADFTESDLLCQAAWVILCSGFRELIVRRAFSYISLCFCDWESARCIVRHASACHSTALARFNYPRKIGAILDVARQVEAIGFNKMRSQILRDPLRELQRFPFIGPVTSAHLAKNLGWQLAKPDRHMLRLTLGLGFPNPQQLCQALAERTGDSVSAIDIVLWRYAAEGFGARGWRIRRGSCEVCGKGRHQG